MASSTTTTNNHLIDEYDDLVRALAEYPLQLGMALFGDATSSDLTIECQGRQFKVHSLLLASRCNFFHACQAHSFAEAESRVINMHDDDPDALESFLKFLYTISTDHIKYRNVVHNSVPEDWFSHIVKVFVLADKYDQDLLRSALASLINNEPNCDGWLQCPDAGCPDHWLCLDESPLDVIEAYGATFDDDFPALDDAPWLKRKLQKGLFNSLRRATLFMDDTPLDQMSEIQRDLHRRAGAIFQKYNPNAFLDYCRRSQLDLASLDQERQRLHQQVLALGGQP